MARIISLLRTSSFWYDFLILLVFSARFLPFRQNVDFSGENIKTATSTVLYCTATSSSTVFDTTMPFNDGVMGSSIVSQNDDDGG